jgi:hypothetical protein
MRAKRQGLFGQHGLNHNFVRNGGIEPVSRGAQFLENRPHMDFTL